MVEEKRSVKRQKEIDVWFDIVKQEAEKQYSIEYEKRYKKSKGLSDVELWFYCVEEQLRKKWLEKRDKSNNENIKLTKEEREKLEYEKEVLKDAMRYCEEEIERDKLTR